MICENVSEEDIPIKEEIEVNNIEPEGEVSVEEDFNN